ncbi:hypothetical protein HX899_01205 [Rhizobium sp. WYCCWR 11146]|nr:hypothetical protein [Rhizobium sp. WYCCWR 11146]
MMRWEFQLSNDWNLRSKRHGSNVGCARRLAKTSYIDRCLMQAMMPIAIGCGPYNIELYEGRRRGLSSDGAENLHKEFTAPQDRRSADREAA